MTTPATAPRSVARTIAVISILRHINKVKENFRVRRELKTLAWTLIPLKRGRKGRTGVVGIDPIVKLVIPVWRTGRGSLTRRSRTRVVGLSPWGEPPVVVDFLTTMKLQQIILGARELTGVIPLLGLRIVRTRAWRMEVDLRGILTQLVYVEVGAAVRAGRLPAQRGSSVIIIITIILTNHLRGLTVTMDTTGIMADPIAPDPEKRKNLQIYQFLTK